MLYGATTVLPTVLLLNIEQEKKRGEESNDRLRVWLQKILKRSGERETNQDCYWKDEIATILQPPQKRLLDKDKRFGKHGNNRLKHR